MLEQPPQGGVTVPITGGFQGGIEQATIEFHPGSLSHEPLGQIIFQGPPSLSCFMTFVSSDTTSGLMRWTP